MNWQIIAASTGQKKYRGAMTKYKTKNGPRTLPCNVCGELYTDIIDPAVDLKKGGYIICAKCLMRLADQLDKEKEDIQIDCKELIQAMQSKKLKQFRKKNGFTQAELADQLGFSERQYHKIEKEIPSSQIIRRVEKRLLIQQKQKQEVA